MTNDGKVVIMGAYPVPVGEGSVTTAGWVCNNCGQWIRPGAFHACYRPPYWYNIGGRSVVDSAPKGWQCPVCGKVHAPWVASCDCPRARWENVE